MRWLESELSVLFVAASIVISVFVIAHYHAKAECARAGLVQKYDEKAHDTIWVKP
jgi:hypothetical protein